MSYFEKPILLTAILLLLGMMASPLMAKKKISLAQTLDTRNEECRVCVDCISSGEKVELDFYGKYSGFNGPFFSSSQVRVRIFLQKGTERVWQSSVLTPISIKDTMVQGKATSKYVILFSTQSIPKTSGNKDLLQVELRNLGGGNMGSVSSGSPYRRIQGAMEAYFSRNECRSEKKCYTKPGCGTQPGKPGSISTGKIVKSPVRATLATTKMVNLNASRLRPGRNLVYADNKSGKKVFAFIKRNGSSVQVSEMYLQTRKGKWIKMRQAYGTVDNPDNWKCTSNWKGRISIYTCPSMRGRVSYAKCRGGIMKFRVPLNL